MKRAHDEDHAREPSPKRLKHEHHHHHKQHKHKHKHHKQKESSSSPSPPRSPQQKPKKESSSSPPPPAPVINDVIVGPKPPPNLAAQLNAPAPPRRVLGPVYISPQQLEEDKKKVREIIDPETGRRRLVRGNGEIVERLVTKAEQEAMKKMATDSVFTPFGC